jgi:hypothetical protein
MESGATLQEAKLLMDSAGTSIYLSGGRFIMGGVVTLLFLFVLDGVRRTNGGPRRF